MKTQNHQTQTFNPQDEIRSARIIYYDFFSSLFLYELLDTHRILLQKQARFLMQFCLKEDDEKAFQTIITTLEDSLWNIASDYTRLFSMPNSPISLYLSHYLEGYNGGESLVFVRETLKESALVLNKNKIKENEDHFGILCLLIKTLLQDKKDAQAMKVYQKTISPIQNQIAQALEKCDCLFYQAVGKILKSFFIVEENIAL